MPPPPKPKSKAARLPVELKKLQEDQNLFGQKWGIEDEEDLSYFKGLNQSNLKLIQNDEIFVNENVLKNQDV